MREVETEENVSVLELRGGTHLIVLKGDPALQASFDLMVDDLEATHAEWASRGLQVGEISQVPRPIRRSRSSTHPGPRSRCPPAM